MGTWKTPESLEIEVLFRIANGQTTFEYEDLKRLDDDVFYRLEGKNLIRTISTTYSSVDITSPDDDKYLSKMECDITPEGVQYVSDIQRKYIESTKSLLANVPSGE